MNSSVITFPGSNCDRDMDVALKKFGFKNKMVWHTDTELPKSDLVVLPGGFGTLDELFEAITLIQTRKIGMFPIVLVGTEFWGGMIDWIKKSLLGDGKISAKDLNLFHLVETSDEALKIINDFYSKYTLKPNF